MTVFPPRRRPAAVRPRQTLFVSCPDGHRAVVPVYRALAEGVTAELAACGWAVSPDVERRHGGRGEVVLVHRATSPAGAAFRWTFRTMSDQTSPADGTTVDVHLVVVTTEPDDAGSPAAADWDRARAAMSAALATARRAGHRLHVRP